MKKYIIIYMLLAASIVVGLIARALFIAAPGRRAEVDAIAVNGIVMSAGQDWDDIHRLDEKTFPYRVSVIDNSGALIWASDGEVAGDLQEAVRRGYAIMDISVDGDTVGKALIDTRRDDFDMWARRRFAGFAVGSVILLCAISALFLLGLHKAIVSPFNRLEAFAHKISTGRFDEPLPMDKGNMFGLFTQSFDVMRESLLEARRRQMEAELAKKELIAAISHDIKTPVTSIRLIAELLLAMGPEPAACEKLKMIEDKTDLINRLMNDMMHSTLEELGELKVNLTSEPSEVLRGIFVDADNRCRVRMGGIPQCMVDLDVARMQQVAGNIIANACKYAGTDVDVSCAADGNFLRVEVDDYGKGAGPGDIELLCTKYYRGANAIESQKGGEGLGLYIASLLMEKMGGGLEVYNRADGFSVRLTLRLS